MEVSDCLAHGLAAVSKNTDGAATFFKKLARKIPEARMSAKMAPTTMAITSPANAIKNKGGSGII